MKSIWLLERLTEKYPTIDIPPIFHVGRGFQGTLIR
jgi:hypothetical protein